MSQLYVYNLRRKPHPIFSHISITIFIARYPTTGVHMCLHKQISCISSSVYPDSSCFVFAHSPFACNDWYWVWIQRILNVRKKKQRDAEFNFYSTGNLIFGHSHEGLLETNRYMQIDKIFVWNYIRLFYLFLNRHHVCENETL